MIRTAATVWWMRRAQCSAIEMSVGEKPATVNENRLIEEQRLLVRRMTLTPNQTSARRAPEWDYSPDTDPGTLPSFAELTVR
jgi:hypothetical protein